MKIIGVLYSFMVITFTITAMEKRKLNLNPITNFKQKVAKEEIKKMTFILLKIADTFTETKLNNTPYEKLIKKALKKLKKCRKTTIISADNNNTDTIPDLLNPEYLVIAALSNEKIPDFLMHAVLIYCGTNHTKELFESKQITGTIFNKKFANKQLPLPLPHKKGTFIIHDGIAAKPIFDNGGILLAVLGNKLISIFNTASDFDLPIYKFQKLVDVIELLNFDSEKKTILGKLTDGNCITYFNIHKYKKNTDIPEIDIAKKEEKNTGLQIHIKKANTSTNSTTGTFHYPKTPHVKNKINTTSTVFTCIPNFNALSFLPPYINRFVPAKILESGHVHFFDVEINKNFADDEKMGNAIGQHYALINPDGTRGAININDKVINRYRFVMMLPIYKWFFGFCLRYGKLTAPIKLSASWVDQVFSNFDKPIQDYFIKTYGVSALKKKLSQQSIPALDLKKIEKIEKEENGYHSAR